MIATRHALKFSKKIWVCSAPIWWRQCVYLYYPTKVVNIVRVWVCFSELTRTIDNDTVLLVMGDHGMTNTGDHGGDSADEVMAGLFAYSKLDMFPVPELKVPTLCFGIA